MLKKHHVLEMPVSYDIDIYLIDTMVRDIDKEAGLADGPSHRSEAKQKSIITSVLIHTATRRPTIVVEGEYANVVEGKRGFGAEGWREFYFGVTK